MANDKLFDNGHFQVYQEKDGNVSFLYNEEYSIPMNDLMTFIRFLRDVEFVSSDGSMLVINIEKSHKKIVAPTGRVHDH